MGMATIKEHLGEGLYSCTYRYDRTRIEAEVAQLTTLIGELNTAITDKETAITTQEAAIATLQTTLDAAITAGDVPGARAAVASLSKARVVLRALQRDKERLEAVRADAKARRQTLQNIKTEIDLDLWVADFSLGLQTDNKRPAPTAEVPGESFEVVLLPANGADRTPKFDQATHGIQMPLEVMSGPERYYNAALLAGWQKYTPGYRVGKILAKNADGTVELFLLGPLQSSQQSLPVVPASPHDEKEPTYKNVPVKYLTCDAAAFRVGDEVLIEYQEHDALQPRVIGFRNHPRPCAFLKVFVPNGSLTLSDSTWEFEEVEAPVYGQVNWFHRAQKRALSWNGAKGRHVGDASAATTPVPLGKQIYSEGKVLAVAPENVIGACLLFSGPNPATILAVTTNHDAIAEPGQITETLRARPFDGDDTAWTTIATHSWDNDIFIEEGATRPNTGDAVGHWFFNASGTRAVSVKNATWRNPSDPTGFSTLPWMVSASLTLTVTSGVVSGGSFAFEAVENGEVLRGDNWTVEKTVAKDFIDDTPVSATMMSVKTTTGAPLTRLERTFTTSLGYTVVMSKGESGIGADEDFGKVFQYLDLRVDPPVIAYRDITGPGSPQVWTLRVVGPAIPDQQISSPKTIFGGITFTSAFALPGVINGPFVEFSRLHGSGTSALTDNNGVVIVDPEFLVNRLFPDGDINALTGLPIPVSPIGLG